MANSDLADIIAGSSLAVTGILVTAISFGYGIGTVSEMGAGFFPMALGSLLTILGIAIAAPAFGRPAEIPVPAFRPLLGTITAIAAFALAIKHVGLLPAVILCACIAAASDRKSKPLQTAGLALFVAFASWLIFIKGLGLPIDVYRAPF